MRNHLILGQWNALCTHCLVEKPLSFFYMHSNGKPRKQCKECHQIRNTRWASCNKDRRNKLAKNYRENNPEKYRASTSKWRKQNLAYDAFRSATYRNTKSKHTPVWADLELIELIYDMRPDKYHVDHIIPLRGKLVCGLHVHNNLQYLPAIENMKKGNRML